MKNACRLVFIIAAIALFSFSVRSQVRQTALYIDNGHGAFTVLTAPGAGGSLVLPSSGTVALTSDITSIAGWTVSGSTVSTPDNVNISTATNGYQINSITILSTGASGSNCIAVGNGANSAGGTNTAMGFDAMQVNTGGTGNTAVGVTSLASLNGSDYNTAIGREAGFNVQNGHTSGGRNTFLGSDADVPVGGGYGGITGATAVGFQAIVTASNTMQLGSPNLTLVNTSGAITAGGTITTGGHIIATSNGTAAETGTGVAVADDPVFVITGTAGGTHAITLPGGPPATGDIIIVINESTSTETYAGTQVASIAPGASRTFYYNGAAWQ